MKFCHYSIYNLTLLFCPIFYPIFLVMTLAITSGLEVEFSPILLHLSQNNALSPTSCGWRSCLSLPSLKAAYKGCCFRVCRRCPAGTAYSQVKAIMWCGLKGIKPASPKLPWQPTWNSSQGSLVLLLKITLLFWIWILVAPTPPFSYRNNCFPTWYGELKISQDFNNCIIAEQTVLHDFCFL